METKKQKTMIAMLMLSVFAAHADSRTALWWAVVRKRTNITELLKAAGARR